MLSFGVNKIIKCNVKLKAAMKSSKRASIYKYSVFDILGGTLMIRKKAILIIFAITAISWLFGFLINISGKEIIHGQVPTNPIVSSLAVFTISLFLFGYGAPLVMFVIGVINGISFRVNSLFALFSASAAFLAAYASIRLGTAMLSDIKGEGNLRNAVKISLTVLFVSLIISSAVDVSPSLGIPSESLDMPIMTEDMLSIRPVRDCYIDESSPKSSFENSEVLKIGNKNGEKWILLSFEMPDLEISSATLKLYERDFKDNTAEKVLVFIDEKEMPQQMTWTKRFRISEEVSAFILEPKLGPVSVKLSGLGRYRGKRITLVLKPSSSQISWEKSIGSLESILQEMKPELLITYKKQA